MSKTSDRVSAIAGRYTKITPGMLIALTSNEQSATNVAADVRSMAASLLKQDEHKGLRGLIRKVTGK